MLTGEGGSSGREGRAGKGGAEPTGSLRRKLIKQSRSPVPEDALADDGGQLSDMLLQQDEIQQERLRALVSGTCQCLRQESF